MKYTASLDYRLEIKKIASDYLFREAMKEYVTEMARDNFSAHKAAIYILEGAITQLKLEGE